jgi:hypothetical protein
MSVPVLAVLKQAFGFKVVYVSKEGEARTIEGTFMADRMDTVLRYLQRKFMRIATIIEDITAWDRGFMMQEDRLELVQHMDGSITAWNASGKLLFTEGPNGPHQAPVVTPQSFNQMMGAIGASSYKYTPPPPKEVFPPLDTYAAFTKAWAPGPLDKYGGSKFSAKFYEVFPREK